uniref:Uncharacterized protein n=1 Tax=Globodera rostochiensis TaxID=31243 RepID=A0A914H838_GLORO
MTILLKKFKKSPVDDKQPLVKDQKDDQISLSDVEAQLITTDQYQKELDAAEQQLQKQIDQERKDYYIVLNLRRAGLL